MRACTIVARNYLPFARVLAESYAEHHPGRRLVVLVIDDRRREVDTSAEPFDVLHLDQLVTDPAELHRLALLYDVTELATAVKPLLLQHLLVEGAGTVLYLDPDICVYGPLDDIEPLAREHAIVLTPHTTEPMARDGRYPTEASILSSGVFNLGFLALGPGCEPFLAWWWERLRRDCVVDHQRMLFTDQRWIDFVPGYFRHHVLTDPTVNVAYWNADRRRITRAGTGYEVDGRPLRFFHFSGFSPTRGHLLSRHQGDRPRVLLSERPELAALCADYSARLAAKGLPSTDGYGWARLPDGSVIDGLTRRVYRSAVIAAEAAAGPLPPNGFETPGPFRTWLSAPLTGPGRPPVSRYLHALWESRPDLQAAFPEPLGSSAEHYVAWLHAEGFEQARVPARLRPRAPQPSAFGPPRSPGVNVAGYFRAELGVGESGRLALAVLEAAGVPHTTTVYSETASRQQHAFTDRGERDAPHDVNLLCINSDRVGAFAREVGPGFFADRHTIGLWAWEVEEFPASMHPGFAAVDEVWALSTFAADAIRRVSPKPVYAFPLPVLAPVVPEGIGRAELGLPDDRLVVLFMFDLLSILERKNPQAVIRAFTTAFSPGEGPLLVIKTLNGDLRPLELEALRAAAAGRPDIVLLDRYLSAPERTALLATADCYVSLHRAEGFGLTLAEAMALGKPVIGTRYSGNLDFMTDDNSFLVDAELVSIPEGCDPYPAGALWAEPDVEQAARLLRSVVDDPAAAAARGRQAAEDMRLRHAPETRVTFVRERLTAIAAGRVVVEPPEPAGVLRPVDELAGRLAADPVQGSGSPLRSLARRAVVRLTRPYWWGQRAVDDSVLRSLRELEDSARAAAERARARWESELHAAVSPLKDRIAALEAQALEDEERRRPRVAGGIDHPPAGAEVSGRGLSVSGWALTSPVPLASVEVAVNGVPAGLAQLGLPRPDVEAAYDAPEAVTAGFGCDVDLTAIAVLPGQLVITATAVELGGDRHALPVRTVRWTGVGAEPAPVKRRQHLSVVRRPRRTGSAQHLLAVSHDLGRGGAQLYLLDLLSRLRADRGVRCTVLTPREGPLRHDLEAAGISVLVQAVATDQEAGYDAGLARLVSWAEDEGVTAVLANTVHSYAGVDLARRLGVTSLWCVHESLSRPQLAGFWSGLPPVVAQHAWSGFGDADAVVFVSDATRRQYLPLAAGEPDRFVVIPNAVDGEALRAGRAAVDRRAVRSAVGIEDEPVLLCVGSIEPRKGQAVLVRALALLRADGHRARLVLVGDGGGDYAAAVRRLADALGVGDAVRLVPSTSDVLSWYAMADLLVCASDNESMPGVVLEAAALGVPVVSTTAFGIPEVLEDGVSGWLCEPSDVGALADALRRALSAPAAEVERITAAAAERVDKHHDARDRAAAVADLLESLAGEPWSAVAQDDGGR